LLRDGERHPTTSQRAVLGRERRGDVGGVSLIDNA
jgi:hypothetical protein